jgi:cephalosporin-C deacetylase-like acetyl esterase
MARPFVYVLIAVVILAAVGGWMLVNPSGATPYNSQDVTFPASDGVKISATWYTPKTIKPPFKTVILIHEYGGNRHDWDSFIPQFTNRSYAVLAYDMRGFGQSQSVPRTGEYYDDLVKDVEGAVTYLQSRSDVDPNRIGVVGAQLGGTVAYASSAYVKGVKVAVAISPSSDVGTTLIGENVTDFHPSHIMFQYLDTERTNVQPLIDKATDTYVRLYRPESPAVRASGIALLNRDLRAFGDLLRYLDENL